ncbi:F-box protein At5g07610-like [Papaver somniferum]|uniref:F-box protein At5g07610-like n=1 Tax=Papaver somniferum TaxID=3469 RepID=UPI000E6FEE0B|nr:F-box protein At5g07610-like [Papaver somniferum]
MSSSTKKRRRGRRSTRKGNILNDSNSSSPLLSPAASFIGSDVDILTLILTRIPSKSLLMFKSVSKQWLSLINDPKFVHKHFIQNPKFSITGLLWGSDFDSGSREKPIYDYIFLDGNINSYVPFETIGFKIWRLVREGITIVQSCNGLLLCSDCKSRNRDRTYYIFNPFTNQYRVLPRSRMRICGFPYLRNVSLAFDPLKSPYYKVICFWSNRDSKYRIEIYDSETSSWRLSGFDSCSLPAKAFRWTHCIFWNGSLYWCDFQGFICYFDIDQGLDGAVPLPSSAHTNHDTKTFDIAEFRGHFYLIEKDHGRFTFNIFELDSANCWNVKGAVDVRLNPYAGSPYSSIIRGLNTDFIIFITEREEENESTRVVLLTKDRSVVTYDLKGMSFEKIHDLSAGQQLNITVRFHQYIESLACV